MCYEEISCHTLVQNFFIQQYALIYILLTHNNLKYSEVHCEV
jgi:hypothetical protein